MSDSATDTPLGRLEKLENTLLSLLQDVHCLRADVQKQLNGGPIEVLLEAEDVAKILGGG